MNKIEILKNIESIANELDNYKLHKQSAALTNVMTRLAQSWLEEAGGNIGQALGQFTGGAVQNMIDQSLPMISINTAKNIYNTIKNDITGSVKEQMLSNFGTDSETFDYWQQQPSDKLINFYKQTKQIKDKVAIQIILNGRGVDLNQNQSKNQSTNQSTNQSYFNKAGIDPKTYRGSAEQNESLRKVIDPSAKDFYSAYVKKFGTWDKRPQDRVQKLSK